MPKRNLKRKAPSEHKRYCWCTPFCGKKLTRQASRLHYKNLRRSQRDQMQDSETATESDDNLSSKSLAESLSGRGSPIYGSDDSNIQIEDVLLDKGDQRKYDDSEQESDLELKESSDNAKANPRPQDDIVSESEGGEEELAIDSDSEFDEWKDFDEENDAALSDEDKLQELEEILSAEEYAELWETRLYLISSRFVSFQI